MTVIMSLFLGLVHGITEFLPVSSSGHLSILIELIGVDYDPGVNLFFKVFLHLGTMVSICAVYRKELLEMIRDGVEYLRLRGDSDLDEPVALKSPGRTLLFVAIGTIPMLVVVFFINQIDLLMTYPAFVGFALIITGGILFVSEKYIKRGNKTEKTMSMTDAIFIGLAQAASYIPGLSRTGTTISVGLARGLSGSFAVRFSLLLSLPAILGAFIVALYRAIRASADLSYIPIYFAGFVIAAVVGFFAIQLLRRLMAKGSFGKFAYYCWGLGVVTMILSLVL